MATFSHKRVAFRWKDISFKTEIAALAQEATWRKFAKEDFFCDAPPQKKKKKNGATGCWSVVFRVWSEWPQSTGGGAAAVGSARFRRGPCAERQYCGCLCCMPEPPIHVCISIVRSCSTFTGQGDYIGLSGERIFTAASLSISSKFAFIYRENRWHRWGV